MILSEVRIEEIHSEIEAIKKISVIVKKEFPDLSADQVHATAVELMKKSEEGFFFKKLCSVEQHLAEMKSMIKETAVSYLSK